jgi:hypothetical protein
MKLKTSRNEIKRPGIVTIVSFGLLLAVSLNLFANKYTNFSPLETAAIVFPAVWFFLYRQFRTYYRNKK